MAEILPYNGLQSTLTGALTTGSTTLSIQPGDAGFWPTGGEYRAVLCTDPNNGPWELVKIISGQGTANLGVTRAVESYNGDQTAKAWPSGSYIAAVITHDSLQLAGGSQGYTVHEEFLPVNGATTITLSTNPAQGIGVVSRNGVVQSTTDNHYTQAGAVLTFSTAFTGTERVVVSYTVGTTGAQGPPGTPYPNSFPPGTLAAPGWYVTGDSNTGLYSPAVDQIALAAGGATGLVLSTTRLQFTTDAAYDIGGWAGATGYGRPNNLYVANGVSALFMALGNNYTLGSGAPQAILSFFGQPVTTGSYQYGIDLNIVAQAPVTYTYGIHVAWGTGYIAGGFTATQFAQIYIDWANLTNNTIITNGYGLYVRNQGQSQYVNSYGIYIEAVSSATTTNISLYNAGNTRLGNYVEAYMIAKPTTNAASGYRRLYPKTDGWYDLDASGVETKIGTGGGGSLTWPLQAPITTSSTPQYAFSGDTGSGMFNMGSQQLGISAGGTAILWVFGTQYAGGGVQITKALSVSANTGPGGGYGFYLDVAVPGATTQYGMWIDPNASASVSAIGIYARVRNTVAASTGVTAIRAGTPGLITATTANVYGLVVDNQGMSGVTNAYGVYINAQSGAATTNIGLYNLGTSRFDGVMAIAAAPWSGYAIYVGGSPVVTSNQVGVDVEFTATSAATSYVTSVLSGLYFASGSYTVSQAMGFWATGPVTIGATAVTTMIGVQVNNQGAPKVTNAYGIYINSQSGAATVNVGLYNAGTTTLLGTLTITTPSATQQIYLSSSSANASIMVAAGIPNPALQLNFMGSTFFNVFGSGGAGTELQPGTDNFFDLGDSSHRWRTLSAMTGIFSGNLSAAGTVGVGIAPSTSAMIFVGPGSTSGANQYGINLQTNFFQATNAYSVYSKFITAGGSAFTVTTAASFYADTPSFGSSSLATTMYGLYVANQGVAAVTNAYGVYIAAQAGATSTNVGLYNGGTTRLIGTIGAGTNGTIRTNIAFYLWQDFTTSSQANYTLMDVEGQSSPTSSGTGLYVGPQIYYASATTLPNNYGIYVASNNTVNTTTTNGYGVYVSNQSNGTVQHAYGLYVENVSGGNLDSYSLYTGGNTRIDGQLLFNVTQNYNWGPAIINIQMPYWGFGTMTTLYGIYAIPQFRSTGTVSAAVLYAQVQTQAASYTLTTAYGLYVDNPLKGSGSTITNQYGVYIAAQSGATTTNIGLYVGSSAVVVGGLNVGTITGNGSVPSGGTAGQVLTKNTATNYDVGWAAAGGTAVLTYEAQAVSGTTVTLPQTPSSNGVTNVSVNGQALIATRDWTITANVITFTTALTADDVHVEYQVSPFNAAQFSAHFETTLTTGQSTITLPTTPVATPLLSRGGVVQYQTAGHYSVSGTTVTLAVPIGATEDGRISIDYLAGGGAFVIPLQQNLTFAPDATWDIGASGASRPRNLWLSNNALVGGLMGIGTLAATGYALYINQSLTGNSFQIGVYANATMDSTATNWGAGFYGKINTTAQSFTMPWGYTYGVGSPSLGAGSAITSLAGVYIFNQGASGIANAYGIYIANQTGATSSNIGLYNAGTTTLAGAVTINGATTSTASLTVQSNGWFTQPVSIGSQAPVTTVGLNMVINLSGQGVSGVSADQVCQKIVGVFSSAATSGMGLYFQPTSGSSNTFSSIWAFYIDGSNLGTSPVTNYYGLYIVNQGRANTTNSYGIFIAAQSGSTTNSIALAIGSANERIRNPKNSATNLSIESQDGYLMLCSASGTHVAFNTYWDGTVWQVMNAANYCNIFVPSNNQWIWYGATTVNSVGWGQAMVLTNAGALTVTGDIYAGGSSATNSVWLTALRFGTTAANNITWNAGLCVAGAGNSPGAVIALTSRVATQICMYDLGGGNCYGFGVNNNETVVITGGTTIGFRMNSITSTQLAQFNNSNGATFQFSDANHYLTPVSVGHTRYAIQSGYLHSFEIGAASYGSGGLANTQAASFAVGSALALKTNVRHMDDALDLVRDQRLHGVRFDWRLDGRPGVGFVADDWLERVPELVHDNRGDAEMAAYAPLSMDYGALGAITFQALKLYVDQTDTRLERAEARIAELEAKLAA